MESILNETKKRDVSHHFNDLSQFGKNHMSSKKDTENCIRHEDPTESDHPLTKGFKASNKSDLERRRKTKPTTSVEAPSSSRNKEEEKQPNYGKHHDNNQHANKCKAIHDHFKSNDISYENEEYSINAEDNKSDEDEYVSRLAEHKIKKRDFKSFQREIKDLFYEKMKPVLEGDIFGQYVNQKTSESPKPSK